MFPTRLIAAPVLLLIIFTDSTLGFAQNAQQDHARKIMDEIYRQQDRAVNQHDLVGILSFMDRNIVGIQKNGKHEGFDELQRNWSDFFLLQNRERRIRTPQLMPAWRTAN